MKHLCKNCKLKVVDWKKTMPKIGFGKMSSLKPNKFCGPQCAKDYKKKP